MRFTTTEFLNIEKLLLDQDNYRFGVANNQEDCIDLIYQDSPDSFDNLLKDMVTNNIGDYLLVYVDENNQHIILDGNRRASILKIINDPSLAPSKKTREIIDNIDKKSLPFDLKRIGCFVSTNKEDILKTVYERHAAGKGLSRIHWSAFATAKFRYDSNIEDSTDWRAIAVLLHIISINDRANSYVKSQKFSFEVFKRLIRHAYVNNYIHFEVFNDEKMILNSESNFFDDAISLANTFLEIMQNNEVSLSRNKNYASEAFLTEYFNHKFKKVTTAKPPRKKRNKATPATTSINSHSEDPPKPQIIQESESLLIDIPTTSLDEISQSEETQTSNNIHSLQPLPEPQINLPFIEDTPKLEIMEPILLIDENADLINALNQLSIQKYSLLYKSLTQLNIKKHAIVAVIAVWSFLDSLPRVADWVGTDFTGYYNNHIKNLIGSKEQQTTVRHALTWLSNEGNCNKHSADYVTLDHKEFIKHFNNIQTFISKIITKVILPNKNVAKTGNF